MFEEKDTVEATEPEVETEPEETTDDSETTEKGAVQLAEEALAEEAQETKDDSDLIDIGSISDTVVPTESTPDSDQTTEDTESDESKDDKEPIDEVDRVIYGMQKRIDKVTAQKGTLSTENAQLKAKLAELEKRVESISEQATSSKTYSDEELDKAYEQAYADNDVALMREIRKHERENLKRALKKELEAKQAPANSVTPQQEREAQIIQSQFGKYADTSIAEIYPGSHTELDINNPNSRLRKLAIAKYRTEPQTYQSEGGMVKAVLDSYTEILNIRLGVKAKQKNIEETRLKNQVKKLQREKSQGSASAMKASKDTTPKKPKTQVDITKEYVAARKKNLL